MIGRQNTGMRAAVLALALTLVACGSGEPREPAVWAAGSSTVFPFASRVAENFARKTGRTAPRVESLGTGGGIKAFCDGLGEGTPDIALASRPMKASEFDDCREAGVTAIAEVRVGSDGVVIAGDRGGADYALTLEHVYRALAAEVPGPDGRFAPNPFKMWRDISPALPPVRIQVYGPPPTSGTRDAFVELAMQPGAKALPALAALAKSDEDDFKARSSRLREDRAWTDAGENDNALLQTLTRTPGALGVFGFSFLGQNRDRVKAASIDGVQPTAETIADGGYPLARTLYLYVKKARLESKPAIRPYLAEFLSDAASGKGGYLADQGLIPLPPDQLLAARQGLAELPDMARPEA
jgi:phosphate transport system substrate-binding protein